jgi:hypothetical protein
MEWLQMIVIDLLASNPNFAVLITVMAIARAIFKPACAVIQSYVDATPDKADNEKWTAIQANKYFKALAYALDWFLSIKLPK